jgi:leucyl aminopeptidase
MKINIADSVKKTDIAFLSLYKGEKLSGKIKKVLGSKLTAVVSARFKAKDFEGDEGQVLTLYLEGAFCKKLCLLGLGDKKEQMPRVLENLGGKMAGLAKQVKAKSAVVLMGEKSFGNGEMQEVAEGFVLGAYEFVKYKKKDPKAVALKDLIFVASGKLAGKGKEVKSLVADLKIFKESSALTRDLINLSANELTPKTFAEKAKAVAKELKIKVTVLDEKKLEQLGCGGILGVGRGAEFPPKMVILEYKGAKAGKQPDIAFVGKGVTFDSGGLNLKPTKYIETMKQDMGGAATVLGAMQAIAKAKLPGYFVGVLVLAENAVSDKAIHPGDVLKAYNGKTIEVGNTDAEGRLILADALSYTEKKLKPKVMVDIATLTGAVSVALGYCITGIMGNDQKLVDKVLKFAKEAGERMWQLPLDADFVKATKGDFTDLNNISNGMRAGSSMGGAFLHNFVEDTAWVHFDIGGTAFVEKPNSTTKYGATGVALRTFVKLAKNAGEL